MYEDAQEIFDYLPIRRNLPENDYIDHLWQSYTALENSGNDARFFSIMPFHLLFMLGLQYKVIRLAKCHKQAIDLFFSGVGGRNKNKLILNQRSVFDIALIGEKTLIDVFQLINLQQIDIKRIKELIDKRNDTLAHAKGSIDREPEKRIANYIDSLSVIQKQCYQLNQDFVERFIAEIQSNDDTGLLLDVQFLKLGLCLHDIDDIIQIILESQKLNMPHWEQITNLGLALSYDKTIRILRDVSTGNFNEKYKILARSILSKYDDEDSIIL